MNHYEIFIAVMESFNVAVREEDFHSALEIYQNELINEETDFDFKNWLEQYVCDEFYYYGKF